VQRRRKHRKEGRDRDRIILAFAETQGIFKNGSPNTVHSREFGIFLSNANPRTPPPTDNLRANRRRRWDALSSFPATGPWLCASWLPPPILVGLRLGKMPVPPPFGSLLLQSSSSWSRNEKNNLCLQRHRLLIERSKFPLFSERRELFFLWSSSNVPRDCARTPQSRDLSPSLPSSTIFFGVKTTKTTMRTPPPMGGGWWMAAAWLGGRPKPS